MTGGQTNTHAWRGGAGLVYVAAMARQIPLGRDTGHPDRYAPDLLYPVARAEGRRNLGLGEKLPFDGADLWTVWELSWLNTRGKPVVATADLRIPITSPNIVESKSLKLYLNSLNSMRYGSIADVAEVIRSDLTRVVGAGVGVRIDAPQQEQGLGQPHGTCLDELDVTISKYDVDPELLSGAASGDEAEESLYTNLMRSNCPVTGQPDWATVFIRYRGARIDYASLLKYLVSYRTHDEFHEQCVERIFVDIQRHCAPSALTIYARYTRRGGIDINPYRSNFEPAPENRRIWRQ